MKAETTTDGQTVTMKYNSLATFYHLGEQAGTAAYRRDYSLLRHFGDHFNRIRVLEAKELQAECRKQYENGYRDSNPNMQRGLR